MKHLIQGLIVVGVLFCATTVVRAQQVGNEYGAQSDAELMTKRYTDSYDSMLNSYYLRRHKHHSLRSHTEFSLESFDALPDSLLRARLQALHTVIPMTYNAEVRSFIRFYLKHMSTRLDVMLTLCEYYHPMFENVLDRYGVPEELKYLTIVESAMNPKATSRLSRGSSRPVAVHVFHRQAV